MIDIMTGVTIISSRHHACSTHQTHVVLAAKEVLVVTDFSHRSESDSACGTVVGKQIRQITS